MKKLGIYIWLIIGVVLIFFNLEIQLWIDKLLEAWGISFIKRRPIISFITQHAVGVGWGILLVSSFRSFKGVLVLFFTIFMKFFRRNRPA